MLKLITLFRKYLSPEKISNFIPLKLIALSCEYLSSQEILYIIDDYKLSSQENKYMINKKFINRERYRQILEKGIFEFSISIEFTPGSSYDLSSNPAAIHLLEKYPEKINWWIAKNPAAMDLLEKYPEKINWSNLSQNPSAIHL